MSHGLLKSQVSLFPIRFLIASSVKHSPRNLSMESNSSFKFSKQKSSLFSQFTFNSFDIHNDLLVSLKRLGITRATNCQAKSFVPLSVGKDSVINAETGSGKTLAYLLPFFNRVYHILDEPLSSRRTRLPPVVITCPNYELCAQVLNMCNELNYSGGRVVLQSLVRLPDSAFPIRRERDDLSSNIHEIHNIPDKIDEGSIIGNDIKSNINSYDTNIYYSPKIKFGIVDIVVTTPCHLIKELERLQSSSSLKNVLPSCIVIDETDLIVHSNRNDIYDILKYTRRRTSWNPRNTDNRDITDYNNYSIDSHHSRPSCQFVFVSATIPSLGPTSCGSIIAQRFVTAEQIVTPMAHVVPSNYRIHWLEEEEEEEEKEKDSIEKYNRSDRVEEGGTSPNRWKKRCLLLKRVLQRLSDYTSLHKYKLLNQRKVMVFTNSNLNCNLLHEYLTEVGFHPLRFNRKSGKLHMRLSQMNIYDGDTEIASELSGNAIRSDKDESEKTREYPSLPLKVMVCTDLASRGIDWKDVSVIINFQLPNDVITWIHRIGRGGRMGNQCDVINIVGTRTREKDMANDISRLANKGDSLHKLFSLNRSLRKRRRMEKINEEEKERKINEKGVLSEPTEMNVRNDMRDRNSLTETMTREKPFVDQEEDDDNFIIKEMNDDTTNGISDIVNHPVHWDTLHSQDLSVTDNNNNGTVLPPKKTVITKIQGRINSEVHTVYERTLREIHQGDPFNDL